MPAKLFSPDSKEPFVLSRSRIDNFLDCRRCFYLTNRVGIARPPSFPFNLNNAVDELLKNEFDIYREKGEPHPIMVENNLKANMLSIKILNNLIFYCIAKLNRCRIQKNQEKTYK